MYITGDGTLSQSLDSMCAKERLDGDNQYFCETCNAKSDADRGTAFGKLPPILTFYLARFNYDNEKDAREKLSDRFEFPDTIDMAAYLNGAFSTWRGIL